MSIFKHIKSILNCAQCDQLLNEPVRIACSKNVCKRHLDEIVQNSTDRRKFRCVFCNKHHTIPEEGFGINSRIQIASKFSKIYEKCKNEINDAKNNLTVIEKLDKDHKRNIYEYFEDIKRQVNLRRGELK